MKGVVVKSGYLKPCDKWTPKTHVFHKLVFLVIAFFKNKVKNSDGQ